MTDTLFHALSPIDLIIGFFSFFIGFFSFFIGSLATIRQLKNNPFRNFSILVQVSLLIVKMAKHYYDTHPEAKEKLNAQITERLDKISDQLYEYIHGNKEPPDTGPVG